MINSPLNIPGACAQCQKQRHLGGCIPLSFLFQEQTFSLRRDMSQQPGQNHKPEKELIAEKLQDHSGQGGHRPQHTQSCPRLPGSRVRGHTWTLWGKEAVMTQRLLRADPPSVHSHREWAAIKGGLPSLMPQCPHLLNEGHEFQVFPRPRWTKPGEGRVLGHPQHLGGESPPKEPS